MNKKEQWYPTGRAARRRMQKPFGRKRIRGNMAVPLQGRPWRAALMFREAQEEGRK